MDSFIVLILSSAFCTISRHRESIFVQRLLPRRYNGISSRFISPWIIHTEQHKTKTFRSSNTNNSVTKRTRTRKWNRKHAFVSWCDLLLRVLCMRAYWHCPCPYIGKCLYHVIEVLCHIYYFHFFLHFHATLLHGLACKSSFKHSYGSWYNTPVTTSWLDGWAIVSL